MKILLAGGGTAGSVMPLIAVQKKIHQEQPQSKFLFVGTRFGIEKEIVSKENIPFRAVSSGKLRRYFSLQNIFAPFQVLVGFFQSLMIIRKFNPDVVFGAGGFVAVPVMYAAWISQKKIVIHQQDVLPTLSNKLVAPIADKITVTFEHSLKDFSLDSGFRAFHKTETRIVWTGNPVREQLYKGDFDVAALKQKLKLHADLPVLLILGGGTGATGLNKIVAQALPELVNFVQILHATGKGKGVNFKDENYHGYEFFEHSMAEVYAVSDLVISRAGLSTISELSALGKVSIIVPMPESHQEYNAIILAQQDAALCLNQKTLLPEQLISIVRKLLHDGAAQASLSANIHKIMPHHATERIAEIIINLCHEKK